jgi:hypothetical protein
MEVIYQLQGQLFEWDAEKAAVNLRKHHISFERACEIFFDPFVCLADATEGDEVRDAAIGLTEDWSLLFVVHAERLEDRIRIISARLATLQERRHYEHD